MGECVARFAASAARWSDLCGTVDCEGGYDMSRYETAPEALEAYAAFHASKAADDTAQTLIFTPNQYGLGNRLRAMKSALLIAMLTGRVFRTWWHEPYPLDTLVEPARIDWRTPAAKEGQPDELGVICLPFATAEGLPKCAWHLQQLRQGDLRVSYATVQRLEVRPRHRQTPSRAAPPQATPPPALQVFTFTDLNIYLADNPHYEALLRRLGQSCPKRMGCLFDFMFSPGEGTTHTTRLHRGRPALATRRLIPRYPAAPPRDRRAAATAPRSRVAAAPAPRASSRRHARRHAWRAGRRRAACFRGVRCGASAQPAVAVRAALRVAPMR